MGSNKGWRRSGVASAALTALFVGCLGVSTAHADTGSGTDTGTTFYVNDEAPDCADTGPGSAAEPFCQIQPAADAAAPGDTVRIAGNSTAYAPVTIRSVGTSDAPVTFSAAATGDGSLVTVGGPRPATGITFSGARYVDMTGIGVRAAGATALAVDGSQHIGFGAASALSTLVDGSTAVIAVDGSSSDISLTRLDVDQSTGPDVTSAAGARSITLAGDTFEGGGVSAAGTTGIDFAGDTFWTVCGAIRLTDGSSGSVENTVALPYGTTACAADTAGLTVDATSAPQVSADYNALNPPSAGTDYDWAGTAYGTAQAFRAGTGQGAHDLDQTDLTIPAGGLPTEHSPLIDSADSDAPGELSTDVHGHPRVDDPLVADTGTGHDDRGATEFQDPFAVKGLKVSAGYVGVPGTATAVLGNPWSDPLDRFTYTFDFGDGTTVTSATGSAGHTYTQVTSGSGIEASVVVNRADGTRVGVATYRVQVEPVPDLAPSIGCGGAGPALPDTAQCTYDTGVDPYPVTSDRITFGDGSAAVAGTSRDGRLQHTYKAPGTYTVTQTVTDSDGRTATATGRATVGAAFVSAGSVRMLDTRSGTGAPKRPVGAGGVVRLKVLGEGYVPASGVTAVTLNVTDTGATASSYVSVYPDGTARPSASNLNFGAGQDNPNLVTVQVGADGYVDLYNAHGTVNLVADLEGYYTTQADDGDLSLSDLATLPPTRVLDTRNGTGAAKGAVGPRSTTTLTLPTYARGLATVGAVLNVTVTGGTSSGYVTVYCGGPGQPPTSTLNYRAGQTASNLAVSCVSAGKVRLYNSAGHVQLIADLQGLYTNQQAETDVDTLAPLGGSFVPTAPTRFLDTRTGLGATAKPLGAGGTLTVKLAKVPAGAGAVLVNLTGVAPTAGTHLTAYGDGTLPTVSNDNLTAGRTRPVLAVVPVGADGAIRIHNALGSVDVVADLEGYYG
ncbi:PKD domain-containing protein [Streptomyces griseorubiginosus]|uniref:PKD domain-containing protein n=1 Tax=Streptomyces griseorubiginosus TaxID=67304 RepID=UPI002E811AD7|nr:PKD domain-containing protein [Streptomyces griseorubiginosus]WUB45577.1 PKD domain-containing protein [Streptomyces griseorubiginosus]WUB54095.1 PKD domain-containing protein [Streptomyces griseorubiginosus]